MRRLLKSRSTYLLMYKGSQLGRASKLRDCLHMPLFWISLSFFDYALFAWATTYVDTAVAATIFELWPVIFIILLVRLPRVLPSRNRTIDSSQQRRMSGQDWTLIAATPIALTLVFVSRTEGFSSPISDYFDESILGVLLALLSAILKGIAPATTIFYGDLLWLQSRTSIGDRDGAERSSIEQSDISDDDRLWYTVFAFGVSLMVSVPYNALLGMTSLGGSGISVRLVIGGLILGGALLAPASILLRKANHDSDDPMVNGIFLTSPALALLILSLFGIVLPRVDLFSMGAILILVINVLLQINPDDEINVSRMGAESAVPRRLGFTSLILALWSFGSVIYLRDEILPEEWLDWAGSGYWGLLALSATVFALIFGFRVARLTTRITKEDEAMIELFRGCENIIDRTGQARLGPEVLRYLRLLDRARPRLLRSKSAHEAFVGDLASSKTSVGDVRANPYTDTEPPDLSSELSLAYTWLRNNIVAAKQQYWKEASSSSEAGEVAAELARLETQLDVITHSKQQGRDISELMSLTIFAFITVFVGIGARPSVADGSHAGWTNFLTELFAMLFVSTIAFLATNLFDIRRSRETPIFSEIGGGNIQRREDVPASRVGDVEPRRSDADAVRRSNDEVMVDHQIYFIQKRTQGFQRRMAVTITAGICVIFAILLYAKWL